jgi:hypothetical protein
MYDAAGSAARPLKVGVAGGLARGEPAAPAQVGRCEHGAGAPGRADAAAARELLDEQQLEYAV